MIYLDCCGQEQRCLTNRFPAGEVNLQPIEEIIERYRDEEGSLITVLQETQGVYGYLPLAALDYIAGKLQVKPARVYGVATFYTQFRLKPVGKYLILLCEGTACHVNGAERIETALVEELNIHKGETTPDGIFTLETAACLGCCSLAPVMMINGQAYGPLTPDSARKIVRDINARERQAAKEGEAS